jgi:dTDP-4-amino-4,6-dideoxygalactose transaminase
MRALGRAFTIPLHLQKAYEGMGYKAGDFPVTERVASEIVSLPMFPQLKPEQQVSVVDEAVRFVDKLKVEVGATR